MAKRVIFSKKAQIDIERIKEFNNFRNKSDSYSKKVVDGLIKRLWLLSEQPLIGLETDDKNVLLLVWDQYYVFYTYNNFTIEVRALYHQKEDVTR